MSRELFVKLVGTLICCRWPEGSLASMEQNGGQLIVSPEHWAWGERALTELLAELRSPTDEMIRANDRECGPRTDGDIRAGWQAMIDELIAS